MNPTKESNSGMARLVEQAKGDAEFFHNLIWNTEKALKSIDYLSREERASILAIRPEDLVVGLATGNVTIGDIVAECGGTCGASCGGSCGASCGGSCTVTCAASCPATGLKPGYADLVINPAIQSVISDQLTAQIIQQVGSRPFSRFRR